MLDFSSIQKKYFLALPGFWLLLSFAWATSASAQCAMACEDQVNVGLDSESCEATITYDMILKGQNDPLNCSPNDPDDFGIYLSKTKNGTPITGSPVVTRDDFGELFYATVTHIPSNTTCTGTIIIDDDSAPIIECPSDTVVLCGAPIDTASVGTVDFNTCVEVTIRVSDFKENLVMMCTGLSERITRTFRVTAANGKSSQCEQTIEVERPSFSDLTFPPNRNGTDAPTISCDSIALGVEVTGLPSFNDMPIDLNNGLCGYSTTFRDRNIDDCGNTFTIVRTWTVVDPCSSTVERMDQVILVADKQPPQINCLDTLRVTTTDLDACTATALLPSVEVTDNCSASIGVSMQTPSGNVPSNGGLVNNLPEGFNNITYFATDECGMVGSCTTVVEVRDGTAPTLTCEDRITVSLTEEGAAFFGTASTVIETEDNCCPTVDLDIRRMDADSDDYSDEVVVTCADVGQTLLVLSRGTDCNGNSNVCMVRVDVVDNNATTTIECPDDITIDCSMDYTDPMETGLPTIIGACSIASTQATFTDNTDALSDCGTGSVQRTWALNIQTDGDGTCVQNITIEDPTPITVTFPQDLTLNQCLSLNDLQPNDLDAPFDRPTIAGGGDCNNVNISFDDLPVTSAPGSCILIRRVWTVIETCIYDPGNPGAGGIYRDTQRIAINETTPPTITCLPSVTVNVAGNCAANVGIPPATVTGECFPDEVDVTVSGDLGTGTFFFNVSPGVYDMQAVATDACGNSSTCDITVQVIDAIAPQANCVPQFTAEIEGDGTVLVLGSQLDNGSTDNCTVPGDLTFRIGQVPPPGTTTPPANVPLLFNCDDVGSLANVAMWVGDESGNWSFCTTSLQIEDPQGNCTAGAPAAMVAGVVQSPSGALIDQVELRVAQNSNIPPILTNTNGSFAFDELPVNENYRIIAERPTAFNESLTTFDLVKLMQHLTGRSLLTEPYEQIAADVNGDTRISIFDAITLQKLILNLQTEVANSPSWRFLPSDFQFLNVTDVFDNGFPEFMDIRNLQEDYMDANFTGVKIGDINMSFRASTARTTEIRSSEAIPLLVEDRHLLAGETAVLQFETAEAAKLGFQLGLLLSNDLEVLEIEAPDYGTGMLYSQVRPGLLRISAIEPNANGVQTKQLLYITVTARKDLQLSEQIRLAPEVMTPELILEGATVPQPLALQFKPQAAYVLQAWVSPNPMTNEALLRIESPAEQVPVQYQVWTADGRLLLSEKIQTVAGITQIPIQENQLAGPGVYFLQVISQNETRTLRLLKN